jgi:2,5-diketo-D-gluconate reductase A
MELRLVHACSEKGGLAVPAVAFGTYKLKKQAAVQPTQWALELGATTVDTAFVYNNEAELGPVLARHASCLVVTKLWRSHYSNDAAAVEAKLDEHLALLGRVDVWLIHFPGPGRSHDGGAKPTDWTPMMRVNTFRAMLGCMRRGKCRAVGVSNFSVKQIQQLHDETGEWPCLNQLEIHPMCQRRDIVRFCQERGIVVMAYGVFGSREMDLLNNEAVLRVAREHACSPGQVLMAWAHHKGLLVVFGSSSRAHIAENLNGGDISVRLSAEQVAAIDSLEAAHGTRVMGWRGIVDLDSVDAKL